MRYIGRYAEIYDEAQLDRAITLARGSYQVDLLLGRESISGATLRGKAKKYSARYSNSAHNLLCRCREAGIDVRVCLRDHNRRTIVIGLEEEIEQRRKLDMRRNTIYNNDNH